MKRKTSLTGIITMLLLGWLFASLAAAAETIVYSEGFEASNGGYTLLTSGPSANWQWGTPPATPGPGGAHGGSKCWGTNFGAQMPRPVDESIVSPPIKLPQVSANQIIRIRFWAFVSIDGMYDRGQFFVSKDRVNWDSLAQFYNNMETSPYTTPGWHKYEFTVSNSYAGNADPNQNTIYLRFRLGTPYSSYNFYCGGGDDRSGLFVDDLAITYYDIEATKKIFTLTAWEDPSAWASCPWIAPWNGSRYEVDNDIYSVARMPENEYRDYYRLGVPLAARNGVYPLELQERESEVSYTDSLMLWEIDHPADVAVAPDQAGVLHPYRPAALIAPLTATAQGKEVAASLGAADGKGVAAYNGDTVTVNFGTANIASGATLVLGVTGFVLGDGTAQPYSGTPAVVVETADGSGGWVERGRLLPRYAYSVAAFDLRPYLPQGQPVSVRLRAISHDIKYHLVDFVALYAGAAPVFRVSPVAPGKATFAGRDVLATLSAEDGNYLRLAPGDKAALEFPALPLAPDSVREFVLVSKGYYVPTSGSYLVYTWDGNSWVQRDGHSYPGNTVSMDFDLSLFLPDPTGQYRVRIWQDFQYEPAGIDAVAMQVGGIPAPLASAFDNRYNTSVLNKLLALDGATDNWSSCPRNRVVDVTFTPPVANIPPTVNPVQVSGGTTPTISWNYSDPEGSPQARAQVQVWTGAGATGTILWNPPEFTGTGQSVAYAGSTLQPGGTYYARVQANDGQDWGPWAETAFTIPLQICGDLNGDGKTNTADYLIFQKALGKKTGQTGYSAAADMDGDGVVSLKDYSLWYACYLKFR